MALFAPYATVFAASFCVMVIELVAIGSHLGGRLADRFETE